MWDQKRWSSGPWAYGPESWSFAGERGQRQGLAFLSSDAWSISHLIEQWHLLSSILIVTANHIKKKLGKNFFREASSTFIVTFSFPKSSVFLNWWPAHTTIVVSHLLLVQRFVPVATGQKFTAMYLASCALLRHTLNTWLQGENPAV